MNVEFPFIGGAYTARSKNLNAQVCQNFYVEIDQTGAKNIISLVGCPGMKLWKYAGVYGELRAFCVQKTNLFAIIGKYVYEISESKTATQLGTIGTTTGWAYLYHDGVYLGIFDSTGGWTWDGTTFAAITDTDFPIPSGATYQDGYFIVSKVNTDQFFLCDQDVPTSWDATVYSTAEGAGDILIQPISVERQLWLLGQRTTEIWYNSGETFPFTRNPGGFLDIGCGSQRSIATLEGQLMFLDDKNRVVRKQGLQLVPASTYQIDYLISTMATTSDSIGFMYAQEGHVFYELSFPSGDKTICYDISTGFWHTRSSGNPDRRSMANCAIQFDNKVLVGDCENGNIYEYDLATYTDNGEVKKAIRTAQTINENNNYIFFNSLTLDMETGVGDNTTTNPQIMLDWSDDSGHTWSNEHWKTLGAIGKYGTRAKWNRLGKSRNRVFRVTISDPVKRNISKAFLDGTITGG